MTTSVMCCARRWSASRASRPREPRVENPQDAGDQRRGDIRVHKDGPTWLVDVGVVCPGTTRYVGEGAATVPGTAAAVYEGVKMDKYSDQPNFVPFIVETGGRVDVAGRRWSTR